MTSPNIRPSAQNVAVDGEDVNFGDLKSRLTTLKQETSERLSVKINADSECPVKHVVAVLDVLEEVGDVDSKIVSSEDAELSSDELDAEN